MKNLFRSLAAGVAVFFVSWEFGSACGFHGYLPEETVIDRLMGSEHIVLARADSDNPFRYVAVKAIRGSTAGVDIPHLVDSATRRWLKSSPQDTVLFAREGAYGPWARLAYIDSAMRPVMDEVAIHLDAWSYGEDEARFQFFGNLLHHPNRAVHELALAELDRAPYEVFDRLDMAPDPQALLSNFFAPTRMKTLPIRLLLLGKTDDGAARAALWQRFEADQLPVGALAGAYAVALIEIDGPAGVDRVVQVLHDNAAPTPETRETLVEALAIHSLTGELELQDHVRERVEALVRADPAIAGTVARQFGRRGDWSQAGLLEEISDMGLVTSLSDRYEVDQYLDAANFGLDVPGN